MSRRGGSACPSVKVINEMECYNFAIMSTVRARIAPSPTGDFHIGSLRTALYSYALAKGQNGQFVVRIEDTDQSRYVPGSVDSILDDLLDYGLQYDEGPRIGGPFAPYVQSERLPLYQKYAEELVKKGAAYYCFCAPERLEALRQEQHSKGLAATKYDRHCLNLSKDEISQKLAAGEKFVIRLNVPSDVTISFKDAILGEVSFNSNEVEDQIILKSDGFPTYHLAAIVDDHLMGITHILRGVDWLPSTPKHILLYQAFGWEMPIHAHLPNLRDIGETTKLSKRHGSVAAREFLSEGYLPEAVLNFLMLLGWAPEGDKEIMSLSEFVQLFSLERVHKTDLVAFDRQKLLWFNGVYIRQMSNDTFYERLLAWSKKYKVNLKLSEPSKDYMLRVIALVQERLKTLDEWEELTSYFFTEPTVDVALLNKQAKDPVRTKEILQSFIKAFENVNTWQLSKLDSLGHKILEEKSFKPREAFMTIRVAITGKEATPPLFDTLALIGKDKVLERLKKVL